MDSFWMHESYAKVAVLFSMLLQWLLLLATFRKRSGNTVLISSVFVIYYLSSYVAVSTFVIITGFKCFTPTKMPVGLWAAVMLLHSSGQERLTAYGLEENENWWQSTLKISWQVFIHLGLFHLPKNLPVPTWIMLCLAVWRIGFRAHRLRMGSKEKMSHGRYLFDDSQIIPQHMMINADDDSQTVQRAHCLLKTSLRLIAGSEYCNSAVLEEVRQSFLAIKDSNHAIRLVEIELNFIYESFHTDGTIRKHFNHHWAISYALIRFAEPIFCVMALKYYLAISSNLLLSADISQADYIVTSLLLWGTTFLEFVSYIMIIFSDWTIAALCDFHGPTCNTVFQVVPQRQRWWSASHYTSYNNAPRWVKFARNLYRRWSESISIFNFRRYSIEPSYHHRQWRAYMPLLNTLASTPNFYEWFRFVSGDWYSDQLGSFVFHQLQNKERHIITSLKSKIWPTDESYMTTILEWHITTELLLQIGGPNKGYEHCEYSKILSDYMAYLLFMKPHFLPKSRIYTLENNLAPDARKNSEALAIRTVEKLQNRHGNDWLAIWQIVCVKWVDILLYAANKYDKDEHVRGLCQGGEFITIVWLLAFHLGLFPVYEETHYRIHMD